MGTQTTNINFKIVMMVFFTVSNLNIKTQCYVNEFGCNFLPEILGLSLAMKCVTAVSATLRT